MDLIRHIFEYFVDAPDPPNPPKSEPFNQDAQRKTNLLPIYDRSGCLIGFVDESAGLDRISGHPISSVTPSHKTSNEHSNLVLKPKPNHSIFEPKQSEDHVIPSVVVSGDTEWNGWPDGFFDRNFTWDEFYRTARLQVHWAVRVNGGDRRGNINASHYGGGKRSMRRCLGVIECDNPTCKTLIRPHTKHTAKQLQECCQCGAALSIKPCAVVSTLYSWSGGVHYSNGGYHLHRRPTHLLHLLPNERNRFEELVKSNPKSGPLQLVVGVPGLHGPRESAADISTLLLNADRVSKERQRIVNRKGPSADGLIAAFSQFETDHPNFIIHSTLGNVTVISLQTPFMRSQLVKGARLDGPINGILNDAAHGWWKESNSLLMVSSTYCPDLHCWVPGVLSYTNGASLKHFAEHFLALFQSISHEAQTQKRRLTDEDFAGVMDFSQAEHAGFTSAFVTFWSTHPENTQTQQELEIAAQRLLKGCLEHFRAQVTRVGRIGGVIPAHRNEEFKTRALALLDANSSADFIAHAALLVDDFPKIKPWISWWMRDRIAPMLFESRRKMDTALWDSLPSSTNAEESMHWKLYSACGRDHVFLEGLYSLFAVAVYFERLHVASSTGVPVRYGEPEPWKAVALKYGRTKKHRGDDAEHKKHKKNDGRPPDTAKELLKTSTVRQRKAKVLVEDETKTSTLIPEPSLYAWNRNSCWLDTSLQLLYVTLTTDMKSIDLIIGGLSESSTIRVVLEHIKRRYFTNGLESASAISLESDRNMIRTLLKKKKVINSVTGYEPLFSWFLQLLRFEDAPGTFRSISAFEQQYIEVHTCSGGTRHAHIQISRHPVRSRTHQLTLADHLVYNGNFLLYFEALLSLERPSIALQHCWRVKDGIPMCAGKHTSTGKLVLCMPMLYTFDIELDDDLTWTLPLTLPLTSDGLTYDLIGLGLISDTHNHFICRYLSPDRTRLFTYNDMSPRHAPIEEVGASPLTHLSGGNIQVPSGFVVYQAFYSLRGGLEAQDQFFKARRTHISTAFNINISASSLESISTLNYTHQDFLRMAPRDRTWLFNPFKATTIEFISRLSPSVDDKDIDQSVGPESEEEVLYPKVGYESPKSDISLPLSLFALDCRCGFVGDGNICYTPNIHGEAIQCEECRNWSHIACQRNARASTLSSKDQFVCDTCDIGHMLPSRRVSERRKVESRNLHKAPLHDRLRPGWGALAKRSPEDLFYYPVRVIQKVEGGWTVRWWRGNQYVGNRTGPETSTVASSNICDALWRDRYGRRMIRLGKWQHACEVDMAEDILADPSRIPYTNTVDEILSPHRETFVHLIHQRFSEVDDTKIPAKRWLDSNKKSPNKEVVPFVGYLSVTERAQIANWFDCCITTGDPKLRLLWLGLLPMAHAFTIYNAHMLTTSTPDSASECLENVWDKAWAVQMSGMPSKSIDTDVDRECLDRLEEDMFEVSAHAEMAGYYQWGLDAGHHQDNWDPYKNLPDHWNIEDHSFDEDILQTGADFVPYNPTANPTVKRKSNQLRPKPVPKKRSRHH